MKQFLRGIDSVFTELPSLILNPFRLRSFSCLTLLFLTSMAPPQTTPVNGTTTFNTISNGSYIEYANSSDASSGFTAYNVENSGWDISGFSTGPDDFIIAGENWGSGSDGGMVYLASNTGTETISSMRFKSNDGKLFDLNSIDLGYDVNLNNTTFTIKGYRNGVAVPGASFSVPSFSSFGYGGSWQRGIDLSTNSNFIGIDEFRITPNTAGELSALDVDNINATNFRSVTFTQITPGDIPGSNEGAFTKTISGQTFTFTPAASNFVSYEAPTADFGGLYALDYNSGTGDGTDMTLSAPSGYSFDLSSFQFYSDRGSMNLALTLTFSDNSTDTKNYSINGNSTVQTLSSFTTSANDVKSVHLVSDMYLVYNNFQVTDVKTTTTLPLHWLQFTARLQGNAVLLNWQTAAEQNTADFLVQHSTDGRRWQTLGSVQAKGTGDASYSYIHATPENGVNLYRLQQRDMDGRTSYSSMARISLNGPEERFSLYPNPVTGSVVNIKLQSAAMVRVYNNLGILVTQKQLPAGASVLNLGNISKGLYTVRVNDDSQILAVQ